MGPAEMLLLSVIISFIGGGLTAYLVSYLREKGKNLATKEDLERLVRDTEQIKAQISDQTSLERRRRDLQTEVLLELNDSLAEFGTGAMSEQEFRPSNDFFRRWFALTGKVGVLFGQKANEAFKEVDVFIGPRMAGRPIHEFVEARHRALQALEEEIRS